MQYLYQATKGKASELPPEKWVEIDAPDQQAAVKEIIRISAGTRPLEIAISETKHRYPNGTPMILRIFTLNWEATK